MKDTLYLDSNEPENVQKTVEKELFERQPDVKTERKGLKTADFIYNDVAIERKEASDLASSIKDRRLKEQTLRMRKDFNHQYVIIEGNPYNLEYSSLHDNSFIGTMVSRTVDGVKLVYTPDVEGTAYAIHKIISKHEDGEEKVEELKRTRAETEDVQVAMLTCINGISKEKAENVLGKTSIREIAQHNEAGNAEVILERLQTIDGIGRKLGRRIIEAF